MEQFTPMPHALAKIKTVDLNGKNKALSMNHKIIYMYLLGWQNAGQKAFPSLNKIAELFGIAKRTVQSCLDDLIAAGLVNKENRAYDSNLYTCLPLDAAIKKLSVPVEKKTPVLLRIKASLMAHINEVLYILFQMGHKEFKPHTPDIAAIQQPKEDEDYLVNVRRSLVEEYDKEGW
ncbi:hypothetical protein A3780_15215 [Kosakonia radicincitans]|uniref:helix-turn-helix domain-containing protein n=1 Tax=Kosakonia radicincitans TaxID=283686 RepID=UPI0009044FCC|nr:helix-turn-helix domain-containing protein [Kosakonia radicincitans]APG18846.1 hypothetical protein A3780_15215 [Kosakonia radicincitans]